MRSQARLSEGQTSWWSAVRRVPITSLCCFQPRQATCGPGHDCRCCRFAPQSRVELYLLYAPLMIPLVYCHINSFQRASSLARPSQGGEKMTAVWASHHEEL